MAGKHIEEYLWNVKEYDEWKYRFIADTDHEKMKQDSAMTAHERAAKAAWSALAPLKGRRVIVDGTVYLIREDDDKYEWNELIVEQEAGVIA
jgi:hypothetical protein